MKLTIQLDVQSTDGTGILSEDAEKAARMLLERDFGTVSYWDPSLGRTVGVRIRIDEIVAP